MDERIKKMFIFQDNVSGADKKHILWQHYINNDYFKENKDDNNKDIIKIQTNQKLVLPTEEGGKRITRITLHRWLVRLMKKLPPEEQIALTVK